MYMYVLKLKKLQYENMMRGMMKGQISILKCHFWARVKCPRGEGDMSIPLVHLYLLSLMDHAKYQYKAKKK